MHENNESFLQSDSFRSIRNTCRNSGRALKTASICNAIVQSIRVEVMNQAADLECRETLSVSTYGYDLYDDSWNWYLFAVFL